MLYVLHVETGCWSAWHRSAVTCAGVVRALYEYYQTENTDCVHVWLSADTDHFCSSVGDEGWGCGYRNFQMLLSSLHRLEKYAAILQGNFHHPLLSPLILWPCFIRMKSSWCLKIYIFHQFMTSSVIQAISLSIFSSTREDGAKHPSAAEDDWRCLERRAGSPRCVPF